MIDFATIDACLASTATEWGTTRYADWQCCEQLYDLRHAKYIRPRDRADYFALGGLLHAALAYLGLGVLVGDATRGWRDVLDRFVELGGDPMLSLEASILLEPYFQWWGIANAGYGESRIVAVEVPVRAAIGPLPRTTQLDAVIVHEGELVVVNHKSRSSTLPKDLEDFKRALRTDPQFLCESWLGMQALGLSEPAPLMINYLIKTKEPAFERVIVRPTRDDLDAWSQNALRVAADMQRAADLGRMPRRNYSQCAPWGRSRRCEYFEWCHGTEQSRELHYERIER